MKEKLQIKSEALKTAKTKQILLLAVINLACDDKNDKANNKGKNKK